MRGMWGRRRPGRHSAAASHRKWRHAAADSASVAAPPSPCVPVLAPRAEVRDGRVPCEEGEEDVEPGRGGQEAAHEAGGGADVRAPNVAVVDGGDDGRDERVDVRGGHLLEEDEDRAEEGGGAGADVDASRHPERLPVGNLREDGLQEARAVGAHKEAGAEARAGRGRR
jgi:hypothetical protein